MNVAFDLTGRTALVAGASSGLGEGFARLIAAAGARVALGARRIDRTQHIVAELREAGGVALNVPLDVTDEQSVIAAFDTVQREWGVVDTIVCNAGIGHAGRSTEAAAATIRQTLDTNLLGVYLVAREGAKRLIAANSRKTEAGRILLIGSITAMQHHTGDAAYAATKAGIAHLGRNFAREWARQGINVNTIQPGWVVTDINRDWYASPDSAPAIAALPRRRMLPQEALDPMVLYYLSDASRHVTGTVLTIDDGQSL
jgi:NAD(P)-dependent dehydrogenase (short-subunit alcohol dehydrogenase family)